MKPKPLSQPAYKQISHNGIHLHRLIREEREAIYAKAWRKLNVRNTHSNGGFGLIEILLSSDYDNDVPDPITQRDANVAATVIQWLGSACGQAFLDECEELSK